MLTLVIVLIIKHFRWNTEGWWTWWDIQTPWKLAPDYQLKQYFFSYAEKEFYTNLKKVLIASYGERYIIFPKVRLADIFEPTKEGQWYKKLWMRHVDFLITDSTKAFKPMLAIELDWEYHKQYKQYKSDQFKNEVFKECSLPLIRFKNSTANSPEVIRMNIAQYLWTPVKN